MSTTTGKTNMITRWGYFKDRTVTTFPDNSRLFWCQELESWGFWNPEWSDGFGPFETKAEALLACTLYYDLAEGRIRDSEAISIESISIPVNVKKQSDPKSDPKQLDESIYLYRVSRTSEGVLDVQYELNDHEAANRLFRDLCCGTTPLVEVKLEDLCSGEALSWKRVWVM